MKFTFLGTGTSQGVPVIGCSCHVCTSTDPKDLRLRSAAMLSSEDDKNLLIDCGPDFREQMLALGAEHLEAIVLTHEHNDHVIGLDDVRPLIFKSRRDMPIYAHSRVHAELKVRFPYAFAQERYPGAPSFELFPIEQNALEIGPFTLLPLPVLHYTLPIFGFRIKNLAYITDASSIPEATLSKLEGLDYLIINCIRKSQAHPAHFVLEDLLPVIERIAPARALLTHISHQFGLHEEENALLPSHIQLAYDGQEIHF